jgi:hypothetical protein
MLKIAKVAGIVLFVSISLFFQCSVSPICGTETGNPEIMACVELAFNQLTSSDAWNPENYLVSGNKQLDPSSLIIGQSPTRLAKMQADSDSTTEDMIIQIVTRIDTINKADTAFVRDTVEQIHISIDTSIVENDTTDVKTIFVSEKMLVDSIVRTDTIIVKDTFIVKWQDTITDEKSSSWAPELTNRYDDASPRFPVVIIKLYSPVVDTLYLQPNDQNIGFRTDNSLVRMSKSSTEPDMVIHEEYSDGDGDNFLYLSKNSASPSSHLKALYKGRDTTSLLVHFDAGTDALYSTVENNRIKSLQRTKRNVAGLTEEIRYKIDPLSNTSVALSVYKKSDKDTIDNISAKYVLVPGSDSSDHRKNRLESLSYTENYKLGLLKNVKVAVKPDVLLEADTLPKTADVEAVLDYGRGLIGIIKGNIDCINKIMTGIYAEGGIEFSVKYNLATGEFTRTEMR